MSNENIKPGQRAYLLGEQKPAGAPNATEVMLLLCKRMKELGFALEDLRRQVDATNKTIAGLSEQLEDRRL